MFQLLTRGVSEGLGDLSHIAVLIHGFDSRPAVWADELAKVRLQRQHSFEKLMRLFRSDLTSSAQAILARDQRKALGVLIINWEEGSR